MEPYIGDIRIFAGVFSPVSYAFCNGQSVAIAENEALYALIGTTYGGDGVNTFNVPSLQGRIPVHRGQAPAAGSSNWVVGMATGTETVTLIQNQLPAHSHSFVVSSAAATATTASGHSIAKGVHYAESANNPATGTISAQALQAVGGSQPHNNMMPYLGVNFIIALLGVFPTRN
ncbi:tail fiber protein [Rheinheimera soli]|uniref:Microcystin-dependent protein n=1 Tax=Rheinheimera soli TaxID=443616 RepID=A0ABU1W519_9GAMM|nr:tail fiber protein [Rheinheimera soli]MDR7123059.1 microcystin-dependent protein [Rheinheimera soli]